MKTPREIAYDLWCKLSKHVVSVVGGGVLDSTAIDVLEQSIEQAEAREAVLMEALEFYANAEHVMKESAPNPANVCPSYGHYARQALAKYSKMKGDV